MLFLMQGVFAKTDCDTHINNYFSKNYSYSGGPSAAAELAMQRRCLHARNPIYSDPYEYEQKHKYLLSIDSNFIVRKKLIDYQEAAEVLAENNDIDKSSKYVDKFNDILIQHYDKFLAAKILKDQVKSNLISEAHKEELFKEIDKHLFQIGKCDPGICEGYGLISTVAGLFPKCAEDSCQVNTTYENLYFDLAQKTNNLSHAAETIKKLLAKDFGTSKSNGEVKTPLMMALYYADYDAFLEETIKLLDKAQRRIKYDYQDAIMLPLLTQIMISSGEGEKLLPYTKTKYNNVAGLEVTLALLSAPLKEEIRQNLRADLETYYELTSACDGYRYEEYQGTKFLRAGTSAYLTQDPELDLFLRQRMQSSYWRDGFGGVLNNTATSNYCVPSLYNFEGLDPILASVKVAKDFMREAFIDDIVLLPIFAFSKITSVVRGMKQSEKALKVVQYNDRALVSAQTTRRVEMQFERNLRSINEMPEEIPYKIAVGQDFMPDNIGDRGINVITNGKTRAPEHYGNETHYRLEREVKDRPSGTLEGPREFHNNNYPKDYDNLTNKAKKRITKEIEYFEGHSEPWMKNIGYENTKKIAKIMGVKWEELKDIVTNSQLKCILQTCNPATTKSIINRIERLYNKYHVGIMNNPTSKFSFAYLVPEGKYNWFFDSNNIFLIEEVNVKHMNMENILKLPKQGGKQLRYLSDRKLFSPKNPKQTLEAYEDLLGCTEKAPCTAFFTDEGKLLRIFSADGKKIIRVAPHEYYLSEETFMYLSNKQYKRIKEFPRYHFHYYEIQGDKALNYHINVDVADKSNSIFTRTPEEIKELLMPTQEILKSPLIKTYFK